MLNTWKWPNIKGLHDFQGTLCHTARWPDRLDYKNKRIAVIGHGSSGIQVLATIQPDAAQIFHWIRSPTWITGTFAQQFAAPGGRNFKCLSFSPLLKYLSESFADSAEQKERFANDPKHSLKYRKMIEVRWHYTPHLIESLYLVPSV